jgi:hypothetical protein
MANQVDLTPNSSGNSTGLHVHVPNGQTASVVNNPSDTPNSPATIGTGSKFSNPS